MVQQIVQKLPHPFLVLLQTVAVDYQFPHQVAEVVQLLDRHPHRLVAEPARAGIPPGSVDCRLPDIRFAL